jgi:membrane protein DedA with SNARE-associated domain
VTASLMVALALATLVSEDLTTIGAAGLAQQGYLPVVPAIAACGAGVYLGDLGLWLLGRLLGRRALRLPWIGRRVDERLVARAAVEIDRRLATTVLCSRFLPGTRLPVYLAAGILGRRPLAFATWSFVAVLLWTPLLATAAWYLGAASTVVAVDRATGVLSQTMATLLLVAAARWAWRLNG